MKKYERTNLKITRYSKEDVITTSTYDKNNAYNAIRDLDKKARRSVPGQWYNNP